MGETFARGGRVGPGTPIDDRIPAGMVHGCTSGLNVKRLSEPDEHGCCQVSINGGKPKWVISAAHLRDNPTVLKMLEELKNGR